jgi:hypothetical protein
MTHRWTLKREIADQLVGSGASLQKRVALLLLSVAGAGLALLVFVPPLVAKFTSDTFYLYERAMYQSPHDILALFVPVTDNWYRPLTDLAMWFEARAFGQDPIGYHVVALASHLLCTALIFALTVRLTGSRIAALLAGLIFLANPHAQQPLWDISFLHVVIQTPLFLTALLAYIAGRRNVALLLAVLGLGVDESGLMIIAIVGLYELLMVCPALKWSSLKVSVLRLAPFATVALVYLGARILTGSIYSEAGPACREPRCLSIALGEWSSRFLFRPDALLSGLWAHRPLFAAAALVVWIGLVLLVRPWTWREKRVPLFVAAWFVVATAFFILSLWPYIADRFLYVPDCALAVLIAVAALRVSELRSQWSPLMKRVNYAMAFILAVWIAMGPWMMLGRGQLNVTAGDQAASITHQIHVLVPNPPPGTVFVILEVPYFTRPDVPPGNDGPYLFNNGMQSAIRLEYGRGDLSVVVSRTKALPSIKGDFLLDIREDTTVVLMP